MMKPDWHRILDLRSKKDKLAIAIDCDMAEPGDLNIVTELVREGIIVWIDRSMLHHLGALNEKTGETKRGINVDVYQLTLKGIKLCNENGIEQH